MADGKETPREKAKRIIREHLSNLHAEATARKAELKTVHQFDTYEYLGKYIARIVTEVVPPRKERKVASQILDGQA